MGHTTTIRLHRSNIIETTAFLKHWARKRSCIKITVRIDVDPLCLRLDADEIHLDVFEGDTVSKSLRTYPKEDKLEDAYNDY